MAKSTQQQNIESIRTQVEVQDHFGPQLQKKGGVYRKAQTAYLRRAEKGEHITTIVNGVEETRNTVKDHTSWIACGQSGEQYILTDDNVTASYDLSSAKPIDASKESCTSRKKARMLRQLRRTGFQEYQSKRSVFAHKVNPKDIEWLQKQQQPEDSEDNEDITPTNRRTSAYFVAPWGESMRVEAGDVLVMQHPAGSNDEVYRIEKNVFAKSYNRIASE